MDINNDILKGSNSHGFINETNISEYLNGKKYSEINLNMRSFIDFIAKSQGFNVQPNDVIISEPINNSNLKQDITIEISNKKYFISLKIGGGNSIHQEKVEDFIDYLSNNFQISDEIANDIRLYVWADGSLDGSTSIVRANDGKIKNRFNATIFKHNYPDKRNIIQTYLTNHNKQLLKHFLFEGRHNSKVDFIYHGSLENGSWASADQVLEYNIENQFNAGDKNTPCLYVGKASIQPWNSAQSGTDSAEKKRGQIQVKYSQLEKDLKKIMEKNAISFGTLFGNKQEFDLVREMNKNKKHFAWKILKSDLELTDKEMENCFSVKVDKRVKSSLNGKLVQPKSDMYIVECVIDRNFLLEREYGLSEKDIEKFDHKIIYGSGVSIKRCESKKYTIAKMTFPSFCIYFQGYIVNSNILAACLIMYKTEDMAKFNQTILKRLVVSEEQIIEFINEHSSEKIYDCSQKDSLKIISKISNNICRQTIDNNTYLKEMLFSGKHIYDDPYYSNYIYMGGSFIKCVDFKYTISNGSGRHRGDYTIVIKPSR